MGRDPLAIGDIVTPEVLNEIVHEAIARCKTEFPGGVLSGKDIFELHDTYGLPFDFIREACKDRVAYFDMTGLKLELKYCYGWSPERVAAELRDL